MSNKMDTKKVKQEKIHEPMPKLRFPEFRDLPGWENVPFGEVYSFITTNSLSRDKLNYTNGSVKNIHYGDIHTKFSTLFDIENEVVPFINSSESLEKVKTESYCLEGDMIFADASEDLEDVGKSIEIVHLNNKKLLSGLHTLLARQKKMILIVGFGGYLFKSNRIRTQIKKEAQGAKVYGISAGRLSNIEICFPPDKKEQQKIADCLSSLDELIAAQSQKLDALKAHKRGLMQQLFPAEGETVPRLRFPEFRDADDWEDKKLLDVCHINPSIEVLPESFVYIDLESVVAGRLIYKKKIYRDDAPSRAQRLLKHGDVIYQIVRPYQRNNFYCDFDNEESYVASTGYAQLRSFGVSKFLYYLVHADTFVNKVIDKCTGSNYPAINSSALAEITVAIPKAPEQQKIADSLSSLDELITSQSQKVEILKVHKIGLIKQLFPSPEEVQG